MNPVTQLRIASILLALASLLHADNKHTPPPPFEPTLPWITNLDDALVASQKSGKPILVEFR